MDALTKIASNATIDSENHGNAINTAIERCSTTMNAKAIRLDTGCNNSGGKNNWMKTARYAEMSEGIAEERQRFVFLHLQWVVQGRPVLP